VGDCSYEGSMATKDGTDEQKLHTESRAYGLSKHIFARSVVNKVVLVGVAAVIGRISVLPGEVSELG